MKHHDENTRPAGILRIGSCSKKSSHGPTVPTKGATVGLWNCSFSCLKSYQNIEEIWDLSYISYVHSTYYMFAYLHAIGYIWALTYICIYIYLYCTCMYIICLTYVWIPKYDVKTAICSFSLAKLMLPRRCRRLKVSVPHLFLCWGADLALEGPYPPYPRCLTSPCVKVRSGNLGMETLSC